MGGRVPCSRASWREARGSARRRRSGAFAPSGRVPWRPGPRPRRWSRGFGVRDRPACEQGRPQSCSFSRGRPGTGTGPSARPAWLAGRVIRQSEGLHPDGLAEGALAKCESSQARDSGKGETPDPRPSHPGAVSESVADGDGPARPRQRCRRSSTGVPIGAPYHSPPNRSGRRVTSFSYRWQGTGTGPSLLDAA